jgi:hypothetical protein
MTDDFEKMGIGEVTGIALGDIAIEEGRAVRMLKGILPAQLNTQDSKVFIGVRCVKEGAVAFKVILKNDRVPEPITDSTGTDKPNWCIKRFDINASQVGKFVPIFFRFPIKYALAGGMHQIFVEFGKTVSEKFEQIETYGPYYIEQTAPASE